MACAMECNTPSLNVSVFKEIARDELKKCLEFEGTKVNHVCHLQRLRRCFTFRPSFGMTKYFQVLSWLLISPSLSSSESFKCCA